MRERYRELMHETPVRRVQIMYEEFGPFWARCVLSNEALSYEERISERNQTWVKTQPTQ